MMDYQHYTVNDLIKDEMFQRWVYEPDTGSDAYWLEILQKHPQLTGAVDEARQFLLLFDASEPEVTDGRVDHLKERIDRAIDMPRLPAITTESAPALRPHGKRNRKAMGSYLVAASVSVLVAAACFFFYTNPLPDILSLHEREEITPKGHRTVITLDDGTRVWLNADSKLTYPESFAGEAIREVFLEGEAFFKVTEDTARPFIVRTSAIRVRVLGTSFNVRSYRHDDQVSTTLVKGKVLVEPADDNAEPVTLLPRQQAVFEKRSGKITLENQVDTERYTSWREGKLSFDEEPLSAIISELERWYDIAIVVEDEAALGCRFSANINNKTLEEVLELFKASDGIQYTIEGRKVSIKGKLCNE